MASDLVDGSISALNYGNKLNALVQGVFIVAITTVIFPILAKEAHQVRFDRMKKVMGEGVNLVLLITIPATVGIIVLAQPIVEVAFERGEFTAADTIMTKQALIFYSLGLVAMGMRLLITRVYYSLHNTRTPMINGALSVGFNILLNLILIRYMAHAGSAFATSISVTVATLILFYGLKKRIGSLGTLGYVKTGVKSMAASALMGVVAYLVYNGLHAILGSSTIFNLDSFSCSSSGRLAIVSAITRTQAYTAADCMADCSVTCFPDVVGAKKNRNTVGFKSSGLS